MNIRSVPLLLLLSCGLALAQESDPPDRGARLSYADGRVSLQAADAQEWTAATLNRPLTSGDKLWVDRESRAELQVGSATLHLDQSTALSLLNLDDENLSL